ncbi:MAG: SpoIID/LytB domain-containing protein [Synechocystis sp.]|nr:SpoIID/LytB domain-containing protein [Synechocystis sp.]
MFISPLSRLFQPAVRRLGGVVIALGLLTGEALPALAKDVLLQVGVVQRFGDEDQDKLTISGVGGDVLTFEAIDSQGQLVKLQGTQGAIAIRQQPIPKAELAEVLVLSDHATFETAEDSALEWQAKGIAAEVTQPGRWQVWAKRNVYDSPLVRRWLLNDLRRQGYEFPYLESAVLNNRTQAVLVLNGQTYPSSQLKITAPKGQIQVTEGKKSYTYGGWLKLQPNAYGNYTLVNHVPLETYLRGVVPHEIGPNAPPNAAKAQTIIARTYALRNRRRFAADNYELCATTHCQVYYGLSETSPKADVAINETKGLVLTYDNQLVDALYSSTTGGVTAKFSDVWNGEERPYLQAVIDSAQPIWDLSSKSLANESAFRQFINLTEGFNETGRKYLRWRYPATLAQLNTDLKDYLSKRRHPLANFTTIYDIKITRRSPSGRILMLEVLTDKGVVELAKNEARSAFAGPRSTLFYLEPTYDANQRLTNVVFVGGGFGHGVGMSQFGSYQLSKLGWSAEKILAFYYPGTQIRALNEQILGNKPTN